MNKFIRITFCLLLFYFIYSCSTTGVYAENIDNIHSHSSMRFAYTYKPYWMENKDNIVLLGTFKSKTKVLLLDIYESYICDAATDDTEQYETEASNTITFSKLSLSPSCKDASYYSIATYGADIDNYEIITLEKVSNKKKIGDIDKKIKNSFVLKQLSSSAQGVIPGDLSKIDSLLPEVVRFPVPQLEVYIASYKLHHRQIGPRAMIVNNQAYPLTGWCSYPYLRAFKLNGEYYVESGSHCCGCGITIQELFKVKSTGPFVIYGDSDLSD